LVAVAVLEQLGVIQLVLVLLLLAVVVVAQTTN
jgi:hypothetical protein